MNSCKCESINKLEILNIFALFISEKIHNSLPVGEYVGLVGEYCGDVGE